MRFSFTVPGEPQGKARARTWFDPRVGKAVSKTPENTVVYENLVKLCYQSAARSHRFPDDTPLQVEIRAYLSIAAREAAKRFTFAAGGLMIVVPESSGDLEAEGKALSHCVRTYAEQLRGKHNCAPTPAVAKFEKEFCKECHLLPRSA